MISKLTFENVPKLYSQRENYFSKSEFDMTNIKEVDSAGIAFLVQWSKELKSTKLYLKHVPISALRLINTFKLDKLFEIEE